MSDLDPQNLRKAGNAYAQRHEDAFRRLWLPTVQPETPKEFFLDTQLSLLKTLYPNIWQHGPRGDIYQTQIHRLKELLDTHLTTKDMLGAVNIPQDMPAFNRSFDLSTYTHRTDITRIAKNEQRPDAGFYFLGDRNKYPIYWQITQHIALSDLETRVGMGTFLHVFTYHSLYRDIITRYPANTAISLKWVSYMTAWGMPT